MITNTVYSPMNVDEDDERKFVDKEVDKVGKEIDKISNLSMI